jgi:hypothetical protein
VPIASLKVTSTVVPEFTATVDTVGAIVSAVAAFRLAAIRPILPLVGNVTLVLSPETLAEGIVVILPQEAPPNVVLLVAAVVYFVGVYVVVAVELATLLFAKITG